MEVAVMQVELHESHLFSSGSNRQCYFHPEDENLCIKVLHPNSPPKTQIRELNYFNCLHRRRATLTHVADLVEVVSTNRGRGVVFELLRDFDGSVCKTLDYYLQLGSEFYAQLVVAKLEELKAYLYQEGIIFRDLITLNIVLQRTDEHSYHPVIIDGIGHNDFLPLCNYSLSLSRKKIVRTWNRKRAKWFDKYESICGAVTPF